VKEDYRMQAHHLFARVMQWLNTESLQLLLKLVDYVLLGKVDNLKSAIQS